MERVGDSPLFSARLVDRHWLVPGILELRLSRPAGLSFIAGQFVRIEIVHQRVDITVQLILAKHAGFFGDERHGEQNAHDSTGNQNGTDELGRGDLQELEDDTFCILARDVEEALSFTAAGRPTKVTLQACFAL